MSRRQTTPRTLSRLFALSRRIIYIILNGRNRHAAASLVRQAAKRFIFPQPPRGLLNACASAQTLYWPPSPSLPTSCAAFPAQTTPAKMVRGVVPVHWLLKESVTWLKQLKAGVARAGRRQ